MTFVKITKQDFEIFLKKHFPNFRILPKSDITMEYVYDIPTKTPNISVRVYSSIDVRTNVSREYGSDSIKTVLINTKINKPISSPDKDYTRRMKNWRLYLKENITELISKIDFYNRTCPKCNSPLILRTPKNKKSSSFFGCSTYPACTYTEPVVPKSSKIYSPPIKKSHINITPQKKEIPAEVISTLSQIYNVSADILWSIDISNIRLLLGYAATHRWGEFGIEDEKDAKDRILFILNKAGENLTHSTLKVNWIGELPKKSPKQQEPFVLELSEIDSGANCPNCGGKIQILTPHRDREEEITHYDAICQNCGLRGEVLND